MADDIELNKAVINLVDLCQKKGVVGVERVIEGYQVHFRFKKLDNKDEKGATQKIGGALSDMGDEITKTFAGTI
jgi:hypothetical protein